VRKKNLPCCLRRLPFYQPREDLHAKAERVHGLREYREKLLPMPWAPLSLGAAGTVNLSGKLGASGSSLAAKTKGSISDGAKLNRARRS
jgi:hypothetical protein